MSENFGTEAWQKTGELLRKGQTLRAKKPIHEMTLAECLEAQKKYLEWSKKYPDHEDHAVKAHIYKQYLLKRIEFLQTTMKPIAEALGAAETGAFHDQRILPLFKNTKAVLQWYR